MQAFDTSLVDWERRIVARESLIPRLPLYAPRADKAERIFRRLKVVDIPGVPTLGEVADPWVIELVRAIFGAFDPELRRQLIREYFLLIAKKNGKSTTAAGLMMTALIMNERRQGEYLILAPTKEIADNSFAPAYGMVDADKALKARFKLKDTFREIENKVDGSLLAVKAADVDVVGGTKAIVVLVEELWLFGKKPNANKMLSEATGAMVARPEGFAIYLSTQSDTPPEGVFKEKLEYFRAVRDRAGGLVDPTALGVLYEYPPAMMAAQAWRDRATWYIPNPSRFVDHAWIGTKMAQEERTGPHALALFVAKHLNVEMGIGLRTDRWRGAEFWERQKDAGLAALDRRDRLAALLERCEVVCVGLDGGGLDDIFGLSVLGREREEVEVLVKRPDGSESRQMVKRWLSWSHGWCHRSVLEVRKSIASRLLDFERAGELTIVDDALDDINDIVDIIVSIRDAGVLGKVAVDPAGLGELADRLLALEITQENGLLMGVGQGYRLMNAIKTAERHLVRRVLRHCGSGLMSWCVGNVKIEPLATAIRATKANAGDAKIDLWSALMNGVEAMGTNPEPSGGASFWEEAA